MSTPQPSSSTIRTSAHSFCQAFISGTKPAEILSTIFTSSPSITEHGPSWARTRLPFVGQTFHGRRNPSSEAKDTCDDYFELLAETLAFTPSEDSLPPVDAYVVDPTVKMPGVQGSGMVLVKAKAQLAGVKSGKGWEEEFIFLFSDFDGEGKIGKMEIWADNLSAWEGVGEA